MGCGSGPAMSFAVRKIEEPMMPPTQQQDRIEQAESANQAGRF